MSKSADTQPVDFYYDYASPFAYLASGTLEKKLPGCEIHYKPVYLRGFDTFSKGMPFSPPRLRYMANDFHRCARHEGLAEQQPTVFPVNGLYALRGDLVARELGEFAAYHRALFRATWSENQNVSNKQVVIELAAELGLNREEFAARIDAPEIKDDLKSRTEQAAALGIFGVPSFIVGGALFWGHDRMDYVYRAATEG